MYNCDQAALAFGLGSRLLLKCTRERVKNKLRWSLRFDFRSLKTIHRKKSTISDIRLTLRSILYCHHGALNVSKRWIGWPQSLDTTRIEELLPLLHHGGGFLNQGLTVQSEQYAWTFRTLIMIHKFCAVICHPISHYAAVLGLYNGDGKL